MASINVCSPNFIPADSYGRIALELAHHLEAQGLHVNPIGPLSPQTHLSSLSWGGLLLGYPTLHPSFGALVNGGPRLAITVFESSILPPGWVDALNPCQGVIVPSHWAAETFRANGVGAPVHVLPQGVSAAFTYRERPADGPFTFITIADRGERKGWTHVIQAFGKAFAHNPDVRLILKARAGHPLFSYAGFRNQMPNVEIICENYTDEQMADLYGLSHVFVSAGREGYGLPPREFAATGGLSLALGWGGTADDLDQWGLAIPHDTETAWADRADWHRKLGEWGVADVDALAAQMQLVHAHYDAYRDFRQRASVFVRTHYRWDRYARQVHAIWKQELREWYGTDRHVNGKEPVAPSLKRRQPVHA